MEILCQSLRSAAKAFVQGPYIRRLSRVMPKAFWHDLKSRDNPLNISKLEQRVLHVLAQGGAIHFERLRSGKIQAVRCITRDGQILTDCDLTVFDRLKKRRLIKSRSGKPYRATHLGIRSVRAQQDNR